jgi:hypothetical protein
MRRRRSTGWSAVEVRGWTDRHIPIAPVGDRSRLTFVQRGFLGRRGTLRRRVLRTTSGRVFTERLPGVLDRIAGQEPTVLIAPKTPTPPGNLAAARSAAARRNEHGSVAGGWTSTITLPLLGLTVGTRCAISTQRSNHNFYPTDPDRDRLLPWPGPLRLQCGRRRPAHRLHRRRPVLRRGIGMNLGR